MPAPAMISTPTPQLSVVIEGFEMPAGIVRPVKLSGLRADPTYQRGLKPHHKKIESDFRAELAGILVVGVRPDRQEWVIDGQQRRQAMMNRKIDVWPALVIDSEGVEFEAVIYDAINNHRKQLSARETFKSQLVAKDKFALDAKAAAESAGYRLRITSMSDRSGSPDTLGCVRLLYNATKSYGKDHLERTLFLLKSAWSGDHDATRENLISGLLFFLNKFGKRVDDDRLVTKLKSVSAISVYKAAQGSIYINKGRQHAAARAYAELYNQGLRRVNKLYFGDEV